MRVVTYARVSTPGQRSEGASLENQNRKFHRWKDQGAHVIVRSYEEQASASSIRKRRLFQQMLADLDATQPDCIVVDSLDRFSRNLEDAFEVLRMLRHRGINVWPLEWERDQPPDIITYDSEDYLRARDEIIAAQAELKRIRTRNRRSFQGRRERGATTVNCPPFGLRKNGDYLEPDSQTAWMVGEAEDRALAGQSFLEVARWAQGLNPAAWSSPRSIVHAFQNPGYVAAGVRSLERHAALADLIESRRSRFGQRRVNENEFTGVFLCGKCFDEGRNRLLSGTWRTNAGPPFPVLVCNSGPNGSVARTGHFFEVAQHKAEPAWWAYVDEFSAEPELLRKWAEQRSEEGADRQRHLAARLADVDQRAAALKSRRDRAFDHLGDLSEAIRSQARKALEDTERDEMQLAVERQAILGELAKQPAATPRDPEALRTQLARYREVYDAEPIRSRNELNRALCALVGSHPVLYRARGAQSPVVIKWEQLDRILR